MRKILRFNAIYYIVLALIILLIAILLVKQSLGNNVSHVLQSFGYRVNAQYSTFRGFDSQKISAAKDDRQVILLAVKEATGPDESGVITQLNEPLQSILQKVIITDPYTGRQQELSVPESLKPVKEEIVIKGIPVTYYVVYANKIFSMKIFSQAEAVNKGLFSTYYCPNTKTAYQLEIFSGAANFNKQEQTSLLSSLYCKKL